MAAPYIPAKDTDFNDWFLNFKTLLAANPTNYGLVAGDATIVTNVWTPWNAAYPIAINPATRTAATIATKDGTRATAEATVRPYAIRIRNNSAVSDALKIGIGVTVPDFPPTPIPAPVTMPLPGYISGIPLETSLAYKDSGTLGKAKPFGAIGVEIWRSIGVAYAVDPAQCLYYNTTTKSPFRVPHVADDQGKKCTIFLRFITRSGPGALSQPGPWSTPLNFILI